MNASEVEVRVTDRETGRPITSAEVGVFLMRVRAPDQAAFERDAMLEQGLTDEAGRRIVQVTVAADTEWTVLVVVRARGHAEWKSAGLRRSFGKDGERPPETTLGAGGRVEIDARLERGATLAGTVTDSAGRPLAGVHIGLVLSRTNSCSWPYAFSVSRSARWPPRCMTDAHGAFEWLSFPIEFARHDGDAHYVLTAEHGDFGPAMLHRIEELPPDEHRVIRTDLVLPDGVTLEGTILLPDGEPASDATVEVRQDHEVGQPVCISFEKHAVTDTAGRFSMRGLKRTLHHVSVEMRGCAPARREVDLTRGITEPCDLRLEPGIDLEGTVVDRDGRTIAHASVHGFVREPFASREANTDDEGRFTLRGLPQRGRIELRADPNIKIEVDLPSPPVTLRAPATVDLKLQLRAEEDDRPLEPPGSVTVFAPGFSTLVPLQPGGSAVQSDMPAGHYEFWVNVPDRFPARYEVDVPDAGLTDPIVIRVGQGGVARGQVVDTTGKALAGVRVTAFGEIPNAERIATTDAAGAFSLRGLGRRAWIAFFADGFAMRGIPVEDTGSPASPAQVDVTMNAGATITGRVLREGAPLVRALVKVLPNVDSFLPVDLPSALSDDRGRFALQHVPPGHFRVAAGGTEVEVKTQEGGHIEVELGRVSAPLI